MTCACRNRLRVPATIAFVAAACSQAPSSPSQVSAGIWGGDHIAMTVVTAATHLEFDCAHGDVAGAFTTDSQGQFSVSGTFVREHGGPIRVDEVADAHPASYAGAIRGDSMNLTVRLTDAPDVIGTFALTRGSLARVVKCL